MTREEKRQNARNLLVNALMAKKKNNRAFSGKRVRQGSVDHIIKREKRLNQYGYSLTMFDS